MTGLNKLEKGFLIYAHAHLEFGCFAKPERCRQGLRTEPRAVALKRSRGLDGFPPRSPISTKAYSLHLFVR